MNWMFTYGVSTTTMGPDTAMCAAPFQPDCTPSPSGSDQEADPVSSPSAASFLSSSSSSSTDHLSFITSGERTSSASPLCFGAGKLLWRSNAGGARAHESNKTRQQASAEAEAAPDVVRRCLRKISRRLRRTRAVKDQSPPPPPPRGRVDDTARERAEALASAIAYCKESVLGCASTLRLVSLPSLDRWLRVWQEAEDIANASATAHCNNSTDTQCPPPPRQQDGWLLERHAKATLLNDSRRLSSPSRDVSVSNSGSAVIAHGQEPPHRGHGTADKFCGKAAAEEATAKLSSSPPVPVNRESNNISGSFNEIEFLKLCSGEEEIICSGFITIRT